MLSHLQLAQMAAFITCSTLVSLGYFISLSKSCFEPSTSIRFLGYICDSRRQAFILPDDKRKKFASLRDTILANKTVSLKHLQKFAGKTTSFALLVPAAKLYTNMVYQAIAKAARTNSVKIDLTPPLRQEISHWAFLDSWSDCLPWRSESHRLVQLYSDASNTGWGGALLRDDRNLKPIQVRGCWDVDERQLSISSKETLALLRVLESFPAECSNTRLDVYADSQVLIASWEKQVSRCPASSDILKRIFQLCTSRQVAMSLHFVPSKENLADGPSRVLSDLDVTLNREAWRLIERAFGPHTLDLMALPSNAMRDSSGRPLRFFSPSPVEGSAGTDVFAQTLTSADNAYVFPPFVLVGPLLRFLLSQDCAFTIVVPDLYPKKYWWPILERAASASFQLGRKGDLAVLLYPDKSNFVAWKARPLRWDLWVFRVPNAH